MGWDKRREAAKWIILLLIPLVIYLPAIQGGFIWDDEEYVYGNPTLLTAEGLWDIWFVKNAIPQYYPLVHTTYWLEFRCWQSHPMGYHFVNVALHTLCAVCLWRLLKGLQLPGAWAAALVFAIHPVHVESVAWITERKNVLSGLFYLLAAIAYSRFAGCLGAPERNAERSAKRWYWYVVSLLLFVAAMLSKTVTCTLPAALLLIIWFKNGRIRLQQIGLLLPHFLIGFLLALRTAQIEREFVGASGSEFDWTFAERCLIAGRAVWFYAGKLAWPNPLSFFYVKWDLDTADLRQWAFPVSAVALLVVLWLLRKNTGRGPLTAALYFGGTLFPALGFVNVYPMRFSYVADHFQYLASIGLIVLITSIAVHGMKQLAKQGGQTFLFQVTRYAGWLLAGIILCSFAVLSSRHAYVLADIERLFRDTLEKNPTSIVAHNQLGLILRQRGDLTEALHHFREAQKVGPPGDTLNTANILSTEGEILLRQEKTDEAIVKLEKAIEAYPKLGRVYLVLAEAYRIKQEYPAAYRNAAKAIEFGYRYPSAYLQHARLAARMGDYRTAINSYRQVLAVLPDPNAASELAWILATHWDENIRNTGEAFQLASFAMSASPHNARALDALAAVEAIRGRPNVAASYAEQASQYAWRQGSEEYAEEIKLRVAMYRQGKTYFLTPP